MFFKGCFTFFSTTYRCANYNHKTSTQFIFVSKVHYYIQGSSFLIGKQRLGFIGDINLMLLIFLPVGALNQLHLVKLFPKIQFLFMFMIIRTCTSLHCTTGNRQIIVPNKYFCNATQKAVLTLKQVLHVKRQSNAAIAHR